jgi:CHAT domain-containing protein
MLEAEEIMEMSLHADLVVLSACESGRGRIAGGEGLIGLSWALFVAGTPTSVVSQWKVDSASTSAFMVALHRKLRGPSSGTKADALRAASRALLANPAYRHPFYWAGFVMMATRPETRRPGVGLLDREALELDRSRLHRHRHLVRDGRAPHSGVVRSTRR